jgi:hypothetical protein
MIVPRKNETGRALRILEGWTRSNAPFLRWRLPDEWLPPTPKRRGIVGRAAAPGVATRVLDSSYNLRMILFQALVHFCVGTRVFRGQIPCANLL